MCKCQPQPRLCCHQRLNVRETNLVEQAGAEYYIESPQAKKVFRLEGGKFRTKTNTGRRRQLLKTE